MHLAFDLEFAGAGSKPITVVAEGLCGFDVEPSELPVGTLLLQDQRYGVCALRRRCIQDNHSVLAGCQIVEIEDRAVAGLSFTPENAAEEFGARNGRCAFRFQQERRTSGGLGTSQRRLVVLDASLNSGEI